MSLEPRPTCDSDQVFVGDEQGAWHGPASRHWTAIICKVATYRMASICSIAATAVFPSGGQCILQWYRWLRVSRGRKFALKGVYNGSIGSSTSSNQLGFPTNKNWSGF
jgi:hypothetical protein